MASEIHSQKAFSCYIDIDLHTQLETLKNESLDPMVINQFCTRKDFGVLHLLSIRHAKGMRKTFADCS